MKGVQPHSPPFHRLCMEERDGKRLVSLLCHCIMMCVLGHVYIHARNCCFCESS